MADTKKTAKSEKGSRRNPKSSRATSRKEKWKKRVVDQVKVFLLEGESPLEDIATDINDALADGWVWHRNSQSTQSMIILFKLKLVDAEQDPDDLVFEEL